jgi:hypothetical protein
VNPEARWASARRAFVRAGPDRANLHSPYAARAMPCELRSDRTRWRRWAGWLSWFALSLSPVSAAAADDNPLGLSYQRTPDLQLIYFDALGYLTPHAIGTFSQSLAWQKRVLGWQPSGPVNVLMKDLADYGGGSATVAPANLLLVEVAPLSLAFETFAASERMYSVMNHELVHVATGDTANADDRRWRRLLRGKVSAQRESP